MTQDDFRDAYKELGFTQVGIAEFLGVGERTARRWASEGVVPVSVAIALSLMKKFDVAPDKALKIAKVK